MTVPYRVSSLIVSPGIIEFGGAGWLINQWDKEHPILLPSYALLFAAVIKVGLVSWPSVRRSWYLQLLCWRMDLDFRIRLLFFVALLVVTTCLWIGIKTVCLRYGIPLGAGMALIVIMSVSVISASLLAGRRK